MQSLSLLPAMAHEGHKTLLPSQVRTRASQSQISKHVPSCEELLKQNQDVLRSTKEVQDYLEKQGYILKDAQGNQTMLVHSLLLLAHYTQQGVLQHGMWAVTTLLEHEVVTKVVDAVAVNVARRINPLLNLVEEVSDTTQGVITDARKATDMLYSTCEDVRDELHKVTEMVKGELQRAMEGMHNELYKAMEELGMAVNAAENAVVPNQGHNSHTQGHLTQPCSAAGYPWHTPAPWSECVLESARF